MHLYSLARSCGKTAEYVVLLLCLVFSTTAYAANTFQEMIEQISSALKVGNAKGIASTFSSSVSLSVKREDGVYTKFQAELLLEEFFRSNKVSQLKEVQRVNNATNSYLVYTIKTNRASFRVFIKLLPVNNGFEVVEMRIE